MFISHTARSLIRIWPSLSEDGEGTVLSRSDNTSAGSPGLSKTSDLQVTAVAMLALEAVE